MDIKEIKRRVIDSRPWRSLFRGGTWKDTNRDRAMHIIGNVFLHLHPAQMRSHALRFGYTWGMGGITFLLFLILTVTGIVLMFVYVPDVNRAYADIKDLKYVVPFGRLMRNLHRWSAHAMVLTLWVHMLLVFLRGGYKTPREYNWVVGVILLAFTMLLSFTGYLLPWDQLAYWAITVGTNMASATPFLGAEGPFSVVDYGSDVRFALLGGKIIGQNTLIRFYTFHCLAVPFLVSIFLSVHFWRVRKDGFSGPAPQPQEEKVFVWPHLVKREMLAAIVVMVALLLWSILLDAPLEEAANPALTPNPAKAPWYFLGLQELLVYFDPWIAGVIVPNLILTGLICAPYIDAQPESVGKFAIKERPWAMSIILSGFGLWVILILIGAFFRGPGWVWYWPWESWAVEKPVYEKVWNFPIYAGLPLLLVYFLGGAILPYRKFEILRNLGAARYAIFIFHLLCMIGVPIKIALRLLFNVKYILATPWFNI